MNRRLSLCTDCGQHFRGSACDHGSGPRVRSRSAVIASLLGLSAISAGCCGAQEPVETTTTADEAESILGPDDSGMVAAPPTQLDPEEIRAEPLPPVLVAPVYGLPPLPDPAPDEGVSLEGSGAEESVDTEDDPDSDAADDGSGGADEEDPDEVDAELQEELNNLVPQPVYGVPPL